MKIRSTVYPIGYDKNGASRRDARFLMGFNDWRQYIHLENFLIRSNALFDAGISQLIKDVKGVCQS